MMNLTRTTFSKRFKKRSVLKFLGLSFDSRWSDAEPILRDRIVSARKSDDNDRAILFSGLKSFLKRNLKRSCRTCGVAVLPKAMHCKAHMKPKLAIGILLLACVTAMAQPGVMRTNVTLGWFYPTNGIVTITNGTNIATIWMEVDAFVLRSSTNINMNTTNWPIFAVLPATNRTTTFPMTAQAMFFVMTASNYWGESLPSNVAATPTPPRSDGVLRLQ